MTEKPTLLQCTNCSVVLEAQRVKNYHNVCTIYKDERGKRVYAEQLLCEECYQKWKKEDK